MREVLRKGFFVAVGALLFALIVGFGASRFYDPPDLDQFLVSLQGEDLADAVRADGNCTELSDEAIAWAATQGDLLTYCVAFGLAPYLDYKLLGREKAALVWDTYGRTEELVTLRTQYGPIVTKLIHAHMVNGSKWAEANSIFSDTVGDAVAIAGDVWNDRPANWESLKELPARLDQEQLGTYALLSIKKHGHVFLAQFVADQTGEIKRRPVESIAQGIYSALAGGIRKLEGKTLRGETLTWRDYGAAALDVAVMYAGVKLVAKPVAGKALVAKGAATKRLTLGTALGAVKTAMLTTVKFGSWSVVGYTSYLVVTDWTKIPEGLASAGGWVAEQINLPVWVGEGLGLSLFVVIPLFFLLPFLGVIHMVMWVVTLPLRIANNLRFNRRFREDSLPE